MATKKYINTADVVELTGHTTSEVSNLAKTGVLPAHKTRRGHWRFNVDAVEKYFGIQVNKPAENTKNSEQEVQEEKLISGLTARKYLKCGKAEFESLVDQGLIESYRDENRRWKVSKQSILDYIRHSSSPSQSTRLITENFYHEVLERICDAKSSILIATGKIMYVKVPSLKKKGKRIPFVNYLMEKAEQGVSVQIIYSDPTKNVSDRVDEYDYQNQTGRFSTYNCIRNHAKAVIIDDKIAYIGSANVTDAGLGQPVLSPGNFELGFLTDDPTVITSLNDYFSKIIKGNYCENCHRKDKCIEY